ncbi:cyclic nucleotide-binding domain protein (macronuclear) [Tetrahymena thermophila SB210]|uniref:Cyclic nucleotide-binding domain protein n=1 Tax=Tetrahymena thermophila (strain SB210) TaxID=312017 RepID=Q23R08_TETTS|nr:cyclic nucleotide-binding domain protein [Tetrahymena thermophila SB210]EAR98948.2 cyclic nucleotide-binding domain protein [Tetrahymena thermophila SB210]|eukprot:XP_001019193.2 cyclic nucleotide-binding domain protein [Tetrahymena thermophila SB210]
MNKEYNTIENWITQSSQDIKGRLNVYPSDSKKNQTLQQFDVGQPRNSLYLISPQISKEFQQQDNEENYVSARNLQDKSEYEEANQYLSKSQQDLFLQNTERSNLNGIQPLNSTIYPKINLYGKQEENSKIEYSNEEYNISNRQQFFHASQQDQLNSFRFQLDHKNENYSQNFDDLSRNKSNKNVNFQSINEKRRSSKMQSELFQQSLQKIIQQQNIQNIVNTEITPKEQQNDINKSQKLAQQIAQQKSLEQTQIDDFQQNKLNIQKLKKKGEKMANTFVIRVKRFQRFLKNMKDLSQSYKFKTMNLEQKQKFNDLSFFQSRKKQISVAIDSQKIISKLFNKFISKLTNSIPVFDPLNFAIIAFEIVILIVLITQMLILPLADSFNIDFFKIGICFFKENIVVSNRKKIFLHYHYSGGLVIDLITVFSIVVTQFTQNSYVYLFFILRLYQIQKVITKIDTKFSLSQRVPFSFQITKLIFLVLMLAHMNGCIFNYVAKGLDESWLTKNNLQHTEWQVRYINSVYFSFITMVTVGYGDITPISLEEKVFVIFMVAYSCGVFGYIVSSIGNIFTERAQIKAKYKRQLVDIIHYMRTRNIDQAIQTQVFQYLNYLEQMDHYNHQKGEYIVQKLSPYLQQQINMNSYYPFLNKTTIFKLNFKDSVLVNASLKMKELTFGPGQIIFNQNDCDNRLFYILKGEVQLIHNSHNICTKDENDNCFGISEFFSGEARNLCARSKTVSQILYLELSQFKQILKEDPYEYEKFCCLKDQIIQSRIVVDQACFFCKRYDHEYIECPYYTVKHQKQLIIEKSKVSINQIRKQSERKLKQKFSSLLENNEVRLNLKAVRINYVNNLIIDKEQMIQLILNTCEMETDIDFYRKYDSFYLKQNNDNQEFTAVLIPNDKIAEEFYSQDEEEEESDEDEQEALDTLNPVSNMHKKVSRSSILAIDSNLEEQKISSQTSLVSSRNQQRKNTSQQGQTPNQNTPNPISSIIMNDKLSMFKENNNQIGNKKTFMQRQQSTKRLSNISHYQKQNTIKDPQKTIEENLLKYIVSLIAQNQTKHKASTQLEVDSHIQANEFFTINDFDQMQEFIRYFPKSNYLCVLEQSNKLSQKRQRVIIKRRKKTFRKNTVLQSPTAIRRSRMNTRFTAYTNKIENTSINQNIANDQIQVSQNKNIDKSIDNQESPLSENNKSQFYKSPEIPKSSFFKKLQ